MPAYSAEAWRQFRSLPGSDSDLKVGELTLNLLLQFLFSN
jgi:hypothetical protein